MKYDVNLDLVPSVNPSIPYVSLTGDIVTDGTTGVLAQNNIVGWNLTISIGAEAFYLSSGGLSTAYVIGSDLSATTTVLLFNFSGTDRGQFEIGQTNPILAACFTFAGDCPIKPATGTGIAVFVPGQGGEQGAEGTEVIAMSSSPALPEPSTLPLLCCAIIFLTIYKRLRHAKTNLRPAAP